MEPTALPIAEKQLYTYADYAELPEGAPYELLRGELLLFVSSARAARIGAQVIDGTPDLVVEILAPATAHRDLTTKKRLYEQHGVREYWIVDPEQRTVEVQWKCMGWTMGCCASRHAWWTGATSPLHCSMASRWPSIRCSRAPRHLKPPTRRPSIVVFLNERTSHVYRHHQGSRQDRHH